MCHWNIIQINVLEKSTCFSTQSSREKRRNRTMLFINRRIGPHYIITKLVWLSPTIVSPRNFKAKYYKNTSSSSGFFHKKRRSRTFLFVRCYFFQKVAAKYLSTNWPPIRQYKVTIYTWCSYKFLIESKFEEKCTDNVVFLKRKKMKEKIKMRPQKMMM